MFVKLWSFKPVLLILFISGVNLIHAGKGKDYFDTANSFYLNDEYEKANHFYQLAIDENYRDDTLYYQKGFCNYSLKNYQIALAELNEAIKINSTKSYYYEMRSYTNLKLKKINESLNDAEIAIQMDSRENRFFKLRALIYFLKKDYEKALTDINRSLQLNKSDNYSIHLKLLILYGLKRFKEGITFYELEYIEDVYLFGTFIYYIILSYHDSAESFQNIFKILKKNLKFAKKESELYYLLHLYLINIITSTKNAMIDNSVTSEDLLKISVAEKINYVNLYIGYGYLFQNDIASARLFLNKVNFNEEFQTHQLLVQFELEKLENNSQGLNPGTVKN